MSCIANSVLMFGWSLLFANKIPIMFTSLRHPLPLHLPTCSQHPEAVHWQQPRSIPNTSEFLTSIYPVAAHLFFIRLHCHNSCATNTQNTCHHFDGDLKKVREIFSQISQGSHTHLKKVIIWAEMLCTQICRNPLFVSYSCKLNTPPPHPASHIDNIFIINNS